MFFRTDLALEEKETLQTDIDGVDFECENFRDVKVSRLKIKSDNAAKQLHKGKGDYITIEIPTLTDDFKNTDERLKIIADEIQKMLPKKGLILVIGIGNMEITPDALGPKSASLILATRHISGELARSIGIEGLRPVAVLSPGVLGQTGIEVGEIILSLVKRLNPSAVIAIDALASKRLERLGCTVQIANTGIAPGSGIGNMRLSLDKSTLGVSVIGIGVPTVVDAATLASDLLSISSQDELNFLKEKISPRGEKMIVTPREIDLLIQRASKLISMSINCALHPHFSTDDLLSLVS